MSFENQIYFAVKELLQETTNKTCHVFNQPPRLSLLLTHVPEIPHWLFGSRPSVCLSWKRPCVKPLAKLNLIPWNPSNFFILSCSAVFMSLLGGIFIILEHLIALYELGIDLWQAQDNTEKRRICNEHTLPICKTKSGMRGFAFLNYSIMNYIEVVQECL